MTDVADRFPRSFREWLDELPEPGAPGYTMATGALLAVLSLVVTAKNFDTESPWFFIGLMGLACASMCGLAGLLMSKRTRIIQAFDVGFDAGYAKANRETKPALVNINRSRTPSA